MTSILAVMAAVQWEAGAERVYSVKTMKSLLTNKSYPKEIIMQSHQDEELLETQVGEPAELVEKMPAQATHHVIGQIPSVGDDVTINGLVWIVERVKGQHGWMRLRLKKV